MTDEEVIKYLSKYKQIKWNHLEKNVKEYLLNKYTDNYSVVEKLILKESYYRILNNINECPTCPICGNKRKFLYSTYINTCGSPKCVANECQKRREATNLKKYGYTGQFGNPKVRETAKRSITKKYGVDNVFKSKEIRKKILNTKLEKYGDSYYCNREKIKQTCIKKYGTSSPLSNKDIWEQTRKHTIEKYGCAYNKEKLNETLLKKYGVPWFTLSDKLKEKTNTKESLEKQYITKKKNHTFNTSKCEVETYNILKEKYPDVIYQYKDKERYPFVCDFYIPSLDLFVECNYHWTHGGKPFEGTEEDNKIIEKWESINTKYYKNAINTWTIRDVKKREVAKENGLNYIEFYNINELIKWIKYRKEQ